MRFVLDMNVTRQWIDRLRGAGHDAVHWSDVGAEDDDDLHIMRWARENGHVVMTEDLGFGSELSRSGAAGPSVVLLRTSPSLPRHVGSHVVDAIASAQDRLAEGALLVVSTTRSRVRPLPLSRFR